MNFHGNYLYRVFLTKHLSRLHVSQPKASDGKMSLWNNKKKVHLSSGKHNSTTLYKRVFQNTTLLKTHIEHTLKKNCN